MPDIKSLTGKIVRFRDARDWAQFHNPKDVAISMALEAAELLEHFQWKTPAEVRAHIKKNKADISDELADVLYWVLLLAHDLKIDPSRALAAKLKKNAAKYPVKKAKGRITKYDKL
ncbi:MAG TPA: nucleotide pyrophosphohydrolase [Elusimicrobiales bacterium]|nr:nucleotide pyrophosphohydrolase [Elusimicrobiales bacterium]